MRLKHIFPLAAKFTLFYILFAASLFAEDSGAFLRRGLDSRALALGGAFTSVTDGASSVYWNPAGLTEVDNFEFSSMVSILTMNRNEIFGAFAYTFPQNLSVGAGWYKYGLSNIEGGNNSDPNSQFYDDNENCFMLSCAKEYQFENIGRVSAGITGKYIYQSVANLKGTGLGFDLGVQATVMEFVRIGFVVQDIGTSISWDNNSSKDYPPVTLRLGASVYPSFYPMFLSVEGIKVSDKYTKLRAGLGAKLIEYFGLKAGYNGNDPTFGAFFYYLVGNACFQLDYATTRDIPGDSFVHHITFAVRF